MTSSFFKKTEKEYFFVLDIGNETVKGLVLVKEKENNVILGYSSQHYNRFGVFDSADFKTDIMKAAILKVIQDSGIPSGIKPKLSLATLPPDVLRAKIASSVFNRNKPKDIISKKEEEEIYRFILKESQNKISLEFSAESGILPQELKFLNLEIMERKIDGYSVPTLQGYGGESLELKVLGVFLPDFYCFRFGKILQDLELESFKFFHIVQNLSNLGENFDGIYFDIGGEFTQIVVANQGKPQKIDQIDSGGNLFLEAMAQTFGISENESRVLSERYSQALLSPEARSRVHEIFVPIAKEWLSRLKARMGEIKFLLPKVIYIFGGASLVPEIQEVLAEEEWQDLSFVEKPKIKILYPKELKDIVLSAKKDIFLEDRAQKLAGPKETPLLLLCLNILFRDPKTLSS